MYYEVDFFLDDFLPDEPVFFGTLAPDFLASERPIAIACLRLVTFLPLLPLFSFPLFFSCMAFSTLSPAFFEYFAIVYDLIFVFVLIVGDAITPCKQNINSK